MLLASLSLSSVLVKDFMSFFIIRKLFTSYLSHSLPTQNRMKKFLMIVDMVADSVGGWWVVLVRAVVGLCGWEREHSGMTTNERDEFESAELWLNIYRISVARQVVRSFEHTNFQPFHSIVSHPSRRWASHSPALTIHTIRREWTLVENEKPKICNKFHIPCSCCCSVAWELTESLPLTRAAQNELNLKSLKREIQQLLLAGEESKSFTEKRFKIVLELRSQVDLYEKFITSREAYTVAIGCRWKYCISRALNH